MYSSLRFKNRIPLNFRHTALLVLVLSLIGYIAVGNINGNSAPENCKLMHEVVEQPSGFTDASEAYAYEDLSSNAQKVFEEAVSEGSYLTDNQSLESSEFRYWDETTAYNVTYRNETYKLLTYTGEGCNINS